MNFEGWKFWREKLEENPQIKKRSEEKEGRTAHNPEFTVENISMVEHGMFSSCFSLCSCFLRERKSTHGTVLPKDVSSRMDSVSSSEVNFSSERIPPSPAPVMASPRYTPHTPRSTHFSERVPPSPARAMASPRNISPSPKFSMAQVPKLTRLGSLHLNFSQVAQATQNFSPSMRIGRGAFGVVYKGYLEDGQVVAIKRAKGDHFMDHNTQFSREVELLSKIDHQNLVKLLGFLDKGDERLIITEYVPNGTLRSHLDGNHYPILNFSQRIAIAIDVAHGLTYLHTYSERQIIHRDVKPSNILLTENMRAKVADFGFARLVADSEQSQVHTAVKGTVGYLDPEYMRTHQLTAKSDVYSFGILLLEILTGRRPVELKRPTNERVTLIWVFEKLEEGNVLELVDPRIEEAVGGEVLVPFFELAIHCAAPVRADRPDMKSVVERLWGIRVEYNRRQGRGSRV
ncbi:hypothetical protein SAY87_002029 [Trapa incisa]|uniref:non-specific serine/threonine protein kinase n=1 Tax=Trapa incisa TaxID=236973 RepID=A0AAN7JWC0_9MYRT|nr:hypothetical protein SAY87_002029 [Trapa incisa]